MVGLLCVLVRLLVAALATPQHNVHLHSLPGFSVWQQHIQAVRQAEARLGERASAEQGSRSLPLTEVDLSPGDADTKKGLKNTKKNIVKNNLESLQDVKESVGKSQVHFKFTHCSSSKLCVFPFLNSG